jgi:tetratricopeptide (TPR) repeat protein
MTRATKGNSLRRGALRAAAAAIWLSACGRPPALPPPSADRLDRDALLDDARKSARAGQRVRARADYDLLLVRSPNDDEARFGLARLDAWEMLWPAAERGYRDVLTRHPDDDEVRAALVDVLLWEKRWEEASRTIDDGLDRTPRSAPLWARRARLDHWQGNEPSADDAITRARRLSRDPDVQWLRDQIFLGEARITLRNDAYPAGYTDLRSAELSVTRKFDRWTVYGVTEQSRMYATTSGDSGYNATYGAGAAYAFGVGWIGSLELGFGDPAPAVPEWTARIAGTAPINAYLSSSLAYTLREYSGNTTVQILNPVVSLSVNEELRFDASYYLTYLLLAHAPEGTDTVGGVAAKSRAQILNGFGVQAVRRMLPRLQVGIGYVHGTQAELTPALFQLLSIRSDVGSIWCDWLYHRQLGIRPLYRFELRHVDRDADVQCAPGSPCAEPGRTILIHTIEVGTYFRW